MHEFTKVIDYCKNPWRKKCNNTDIEVYIFFKNTRKPICRKCWNKIVENDYEW